MGADHLLFLATLLLGVQRRRDWLWPLSAFTVAQSVTLALSALEIAHAPGVIVEPLVAESIVLMAYLNLRVCSPSRRWHLAPVLRCGLLHGFAFSSALNLLMASNQRCAATLAGFNVGVELGQILFVVGVWLLFKWSARLPLPRLVNPLPIPWRRLGSVAAAVLGCVWFVQRILSA